MHFIDVDGIPVDSVDELSSFYQSVSSLITQREVTHSDVLCLYSKLDNLDSFVHQCCDVLTVVCS